MKPGDKVKMTDAGIAVSPKSKRFGVFIRHVKNYTHHPRRVMVLQNGNRCPQVWSERFWEIDPMETEDK